MSCELISKKPSLLQCPCLSWKRRRPCKTQRQTRDGTSILRWHGRKMVWSASIACYNARVVMNVWKCNTEITSRREISSRSVETVWPLLVVMAMKKDSSRDTAECLIKSTEQIAEDRDFRQGVLYIDTYMYICAWSRRVSSASRQLGESSLWSKAIIILSIVKSTKGFITISGYYWYWNKCMCRNILSVSNIVLWCRLATQTVRPTMSGP